MIANHYEKHPNELFESRPQETLALPQGVSNHLGRLRLLWEA